MAGAGLDLDVLPFRGLGGSDMGDSVEIGAGVCGWLRVVFAIRLAPTSLLLGMVLRLVIFPWCTVLCAIVEFPPPSTRFSAPRDLLLFVVYLILNMQVTLC